MPTQTFWNLPAAKRQHLIDIAVEEFANNEYHNASISRIVAQAGIAKGSIYQYFADKQDMFLFLLDLSNKQRLAFVQNEPPPAPDMDFWQTLRWQIGASTRAALAYPLLTRLFLRAMQSQVPFRDQMLGDMKALAGQHWRALVQQGIDQGTVDPAIDPQLAVMLLTATFNELGNYVHQRLEINSTNLHEMDVALFQTPEVERIFDDVIWMLRRGIGRNEQEIKR